jgi:hypothetical protein
MSEVSDAGGNSNFEECRSSNAAVFDETVNTASSEFCCLVKLFNLSRNACCQSQSSTDPMSAASGTFEKHHPREHLPSTPTVHSSTLTKHTHQTPQSISNHASSTWRSRACPPQAYRPCRKARDHCPGTRSPAFDCCRTHCFSGCPRSAPCGCYSSGPRSLRSDGLYRCVRFPPKPSSQAA